jgi:hypothetical protein
LERLERLKLLEPLSEISYVARGDVRRS